MALVLVGCSADDTDSTPVDLRAALNPDAAATCTYHCKLAGVASYQACRTVGGGHDACTIAHDDAASRCAISWCSVEPPTIGLPPAVVVDFDWSVPPTIDGLATIGSEVLQEELWRLAEALPQTNAVQSLADACEFVCTVTAGNDFAACAESGGHPDVCDQVFRDSLRDCSLAKCNLGAP